MSRVGGGVPVVDISADPVAVGAELDEICRTTGFFQITGHGVEDGVAGPAWTMATAFFDLPLAEKLSVARPTADYPYGYIPMAGEALSDLAEIYIVSEVAAGEGEGIKVERTTYEKCGRCWRHLPEVSEDGALCGRCDRVVNG